MVRKITDQPVGRHCAPEDGQPESVESVGRIRRWRRRHPVAFGLGVFGGLVSLGVGVAWALFTITAPVSGSVQAAKATVAFTNNGATTMSGATCSSTVNAGTLNVTMANAYPGSSCTFKPAITASGSTENMVVSGVQLNGLPTGWTAKVDAASCGETVTTNSASPATVSFTITMSTTAASDGATTPITATGSGIQLTPASQWVTGTAC